MSDIWKQFSQLKRQDILSALEIEFCRFLQNHSPKESDEVLLAACLTGYSHRQGNVCLLLEEVAGRPLFEEAENTTGLKGPELPVWLAGLKTSPLVGNPGEFKPLILDESNRLYLHKLWYYEQNLAQNIIKHSMAGSRPVNDRFFTESLSRLFEDTSPGEINWQKIAATAATLKNLTIISGGPGTGKTFTVARILALALEQGRAEGKYPAVALAAPTGKAAARLKDSILSLKDSMPIDEEIREAIPVETMTLHQLLGARRRSSVFRHNRDNPLPYDLVIIDEASMVDQALMSKLLDALLDDTQLVLLGDKDQLASVEAGSVMGDLCAIDENRLSKKFAERLKSLSVDVPSSCVTGHKEILTDHIILLTKNYRFGSDSGIARLAEAVNKGDEKKARQILESDQYAEVRFTPVSGVDDPGQMLERNVTDYFRRIINASSPEEAFQVFDSFRMLTAHRRGPWGAEHLNRVIEYILHRQGLIPAYRKWYPGRPVIINRNDYSLDLYNGDTGICLPGPGGSFKVYVRHEGSLRSLSPARLPDYSLAFALTVHKSQGSEFGSVLLILPDKPSRVLTRELLYTAITRARREVTIAGNTTVLSEGIQTRLRRASGLKDRLWGRMESPLEGR